MRKQLILKNHSLEVFIDGKGKHTIVIIPGMFCSFDEWFPIMKTLSKFCKVISFHRPGYGNSELGNEEKTIKNVSYILKELLDKLNVVKPVILVGHSYGGLCAQQFINTYPEKVDSLVLVDSTSINLHKLDELELPISNKINSDEHWIELCSKYSKMNNNELKRHIKPTLTSYQKLLPLENQKYLLEFVTNPSAYHAMMLELQTWKNCARSLKKLQFKIDIPLRIISRDKKYSIKEALSEGIPLKEAILIEDAWEELINEQLNISNNNKLIVAQNSGHSIHIDRLDVILDVIQELI